MGSYGPPVDQLLRIGEDLRYTGDEWHDYLGMGIGPEHVPDLIRMAVDPDLSSADADSSEVWAPIHARRALGVLHAEPAIPALVGLQAAQSLHVYDDWVTEEVPVILGMIGPAAIPEQTRLLEREDASEYARENAARSLVEVVKRHPEARPGVLATLTRLLEDAERHERSLNGFLVLYLIDLEAKESAEVIERAYAGTFVDDSICGTWYDVWHRLHLEGEPPPRTERLDRIGPFPFPGQSTDSPARSGDQTGRRPTEARSTVERKDRNKARQKLEKKVKGKGGRRR